VPVMGSHHPRLAVAAAVCAMSAFAMSGALLALPATALADDVLGGSQLAQPGFVVDTTPGVPALPVTTATSFVVADADTGQVLAAHNAHQKLAPASTLKTLTALTLLPRLTPLQTTVAQSDAPSVDGTKAGIVAGTTYTADNLFTAMLMMSANDAAVSLADANGGVPATIDEMNALAAHLQADDTVAKTPNGLDAAGQSSSAYDLALIFRAGLAVPQFKHYLALKSAAFPAPKASSFQIQTHDRLLTEYTGMIGGKNGYTVAAQASYVGAATRDGHTIIVAVMRDQANFWPEVKTLLDWGFKADPVVTPVGELVGPYVPTPTPLPSPSEAAASPVVPAAVIPVAAPKADLRRTGSGAGVAISGVLVWSAVGAGGLFFVAAAWQLAGRRRRRSDTDERYLRGLSRLSPGDEIA
jgi:serine-type D-Ala-D-Ala carboxypeptidase (penicillin-binding protein 5/6)